MGIRTNSPAWPKTYASAIQRGGAGDRCRRLVVQSTDEDEMLWAFRAVVRERVVTLCFIAGHNEYPIDNFEFHTHLEGAHHSHGDATSKVVEMPGMALDGCAAPSERRALTSRLFFQHNQSEITRHCTVAIDANPRTTYLPAKAAPLRPIWRVVAPAVLYDLGFAIEHGWHSCWPRLAYS